MAGYLITLGDMAALENCIRTGTYSTIMSNPQHNAWGVNHEGTFADYLSMKEGDSIFFFIQRKIYGCGRLVNINGDCKFLNYKMADIPSNNARHEYPENRLLQYGTSQNRCFCTFVPDPSFFKDGIDMDEVLQNKSCPFHSVRTLWKLSFIKMDDEESNALFEIVLKHNEEFIESKESTFEYDDLYHSLLKQKDLADYHLTSSGLISACVNGQTVSHEMALEAALCEKLSGEGIEPLGKWDYISHQVCASPFKPVDYMDKIDIFGYRYIPGYKVKSKYLIAELKKGPATADVVGQLLKYVDWVSDEYANGDYSMIEAYIIATGYDEEIKELVRSHAIRNFNKGFRPTQFCVWTGLKLVQYRIENNEVMCTLVSLSN